MRQVTSAASLEPKPLGLVWVCGCRPVVMSGLAEMLRTEARIHRGQEPPTNGSPTSILLCSDEVGDSVSKIEGLLAKFPGVPIEVLGSECDLQLARDVLRGGASGVIHLGIEASQIVRSFSVVLEGQLAVPRELLNRLVVVEDTLPSQLENLTLRQLEIVGLAAEGLSNTQIARRLFLSESTIKQHLRAAFKVLKVRNRTEAAKLFRSERR